MVSDTVYREDIEKIYDPVVARVISLVQGQVDKVEKAGHRVSVCLFLFFSNLGIALADFVPSGHHSGRWVWFLGIPISPSESRAVQQKARQRSSYLTS